MKYLGVDLGTANTYIYASANGSIAAPVLLPGISDDNGSIATVVMYENDRPALCGNIAEAEYYSQPGLRKKRRLAGQFKPEIGPGTKTAMQAATDFLTLLRQNLPEEAAAARAFVTAGTPALAREDYSLNLGRCFTEAGWIRPEFCRESDAALVSALQSGALKVDEISRKCLIMDFGGGTCDCTSIENLDVLQNGGDILYGGRLFDDLIYQAFCSQNPDFAQNGPDSPYAWHGHWLECREQKEKLSQLLAKDPDAKASLRLVWYDKQGASHEAYLQDYGRDEFLRDAENYRASPELLDMLAPYRNRGGLSQSGRDLLAGRVTGLISWLRAMLTEIAKRREIAAVILTGGSSRWFFVEELCRELFTGARILPSGRQYEDIAFGLAMFPQLKTARMQAQTLLEQKLPQFTARCMEIAARLVENQAASTASLCSERIVQRDIMPCLEEARQTPMTAQNLERLFAEKISQDQGLSEIAQKAGETLRSEIGQRLNFEFKNWLNSNGVPLAPAFDFPAAEVGENFFRHVNVKISRLDSLNLMAFTLKNILPAIAGATTAGVIAHGGEPVSVAIGGGAAFGATWLLARVAPHWLEQRKLPPFILTEKRAKKIADSNREHIDQALRQEFADIQAHLNIEIEMRLKTSLAAMLASLTALNQVRQN